MIDQARSTNEQVGGRLAFETLLAEVSSRFVNLAPGDVDREIEEALRRVCELLGIDLAVLWQWSDAASDDILPTHFYFAQGGPRPSEPMRQEQYPWSRQQALAGRPFWFSSFDDLPPEAAVDRETFRLYGIQSALGVPLSVGGEAVGILGLNALKAARDWPEALVHRLQLVAQVFGNALARKRHELRLQESEETNRATF
jgi:GAF domain-containing protein